MWGDPGPDPGGTNKGGDTSTGPPSNQELMDLKDQFEQQQVLIAQLKEMLRKTEQTTVTEEKVEEYANTLTRMNARAKKGKLRREEGKLEITVKTTTIETPAKEKIMLLRQQMEENKLKLAERGKFKKGIEETVTQLKAQLDDSQQLISQTPLNLSLTEPKTENYNVQSSSEELFNLVLSKDKWIAELNSKIQKLEANVIDLQENVKEKDSVIDARTKAITLMTESLSKKGKHTLDALDDTKEQMRKMQENFVNLEMQMKSEKEQLVIELGQKSNEIEQLQGINSELEKKCREQESEIEKYKNEDNNTREEELNKQIEELNGRIAELEVELTSTKPGEVQRDSPQRSSRKGKKGQKLQKSKSKESSDDSEAKFVELQKRVEDGKVECEKQLNKISEYETTISELTLTIEELKAIQASFKPALQKETDLETGEAAKLKKQLDDSNKNMIKIKAQHKGKIKELNKTIDELKKNKDGNADLIKLQNENSKLVETIEFLEKQKSDENRDGANLNKDSTEERIRELEIQLIEQSEMLESKTQSIAALEEQINSYKTEIKTLNERFQKLSNLENDQVVSEITSIHFEELLDRLEIEKRELLQEKEDVLKEKEELSQKIEALIKEKQEMNAKLESYVQENMELIDKLEKLSAEKVSSAESIEIVEGLTQQEKLELEAYQKSLEMTSENVKGSDENLEQNPELNESVNRLTEETSDLLRKIELFTEERREVMEKMEALGAENNQLSLKIREIENNRDILAETYEQLQNEKEDLDAKLELQKKKISDLEVKIVELEKTNESLKEKLGDTHEIKHGSEEEEMLKLETVTPLAAAPSEPNLDLQSQIDEYKALVEIQKQEIQELRLQLLSQKDLSEANRNLHEKITSLQTQYETLLSENERLNKTVKENGELVHEKDSIETDLVAAKKRISELDVKLTTNLDEIENYKSILEENKDELISSANLINDLQSKLQEKQNEIVHYEGEISHLNSVIAELNSAVSHLENENEQNVSNNETMELMSDQLQELKAILNENIKQIERYETEMQENTNTITSLNTQLKDLNGKLLDMEHELECKDDEIKKLIKERENKEMVVANLQGELKEKDEGFHQVVNTLKEKYLSLQSQIEQNAGSIDDIKNPLPKIEELENKNKEQLEKMKRIAANLKKKTIAYQELQTIHKNDTEKWETEKKEKEQLQETVETQENKIQSLLEQLHDLEKEFSLVHSELTVNSKEVANLTNELAKLKDENEELQNVKQSCEMMINRLTTQSSTENNNLNTEINEKNENIKDLQQQLETLQYHSQTNSNALHAKIQELEMFIESQEAELTKHKDQVNRLEEGLSTVEERRMSLERKTIELDSQLQEKSNSYEEISQTEDILEQRLAALMVHDEKIERRLREANMENQELTDRNRILSDENNELKHKLSTATERNLDVSTSLEKLGDLEIDNDRLRNTVVNLEAEMKRVHAECDKKLHERKLEVETMEMELQGQLVEMDNERKALLVQCEQLQDQLQEQIEAQTLLRDDLEQCKQKLEQQQSELHNRTCEYEQVSAENKNSLAIIEELNLQLSKLTVQNADAHNETVHELQRVIAERDAEIENYRKQNLQLQMQGTLGQSPSVGQGQLFDQTQLFSQNQPLYGQSQLFDIPIQIDQQSSTSDQELQSVKNDLETAQSQLAALQTKNTELHGLNSDLKKQIEELRRPQQGTEHEQGITTFTWPEHPSHDPFEFVTAPAQNSPVAEPVIPVVSEPLLGASTSAPDNTKVEAVSEARISTNTKDELLKKIKTLEFMLYNTEKEKDDVLSEFQQLMNEVARLIYEQQNAAQLESQICTQSDTVLTEEECKNLKEVEFGKAKEYKPETEHAVLEETVTSTDAYLCYKPDAPPFTDYELPKPPPHQELQHFNFEAQIMSPRETALTEWDLEQLRNLEFEQTRPNKHATDSSATAQPVTEDVIQPKTAYLCYPLQNPVEGSSDVEQKGAHYVEPQIVSRQEAEITKEDLGRLQEVEFEKTKDVTKSQVVLEDVMESKPTYLCYKPEPSGVHLDVFDENDDGWGCGPEEVKLEEDHHQRTSRNLSFGHHRVEELDERVRVLEMERERHLEEIRQAQVKSGKLIKKLKEFKALNDKLTADLKKSSDFGGLEDAIQDELRSQVAQLEKRIREIGAELEREKAEKGNLHKRADVLQAANERMVEMKEKQDVEVLMWQRQARELSTKLEQFEWGDGGFDSPKHAKRDEQQPRATANAEAQNFERKIQDLNRMVDDLTLDNEELQVMLEEQRNLRIAAEKASKSVIELVPENMKTEAEYSSLVVEKNSLSEQLTSSAKEKKALQEQLNNLIKTNGQLQEELRAMVEERTRLELLVTENGSSVQELSAQLQNMQAQNRNTQEILKELNEAQTKVSSLERENVELSDRLRNSELAAQQLHSENSSLADVQMKFDQEKVELLHETNVQIESLHISLAEHQHKHGELEEKLKESRRAADEILKAKDDHLSELTDQLEAERASLATTIQQLADEWSQRVDQRGADVAESWKLHLDSRETEFAQVEQQLRKELNELEEKCNALVNENNELRRNVDAEIRNEVDKISALQQQINDRQHYINDLTKLMQDNQAELERQHQKVAELEGVSSQVKERDEKIDEIEGRISSLLIENEEKDRVIGELRRTLQELTELQQQLDSDQLTVVNLQETVGEKQRLIEEYSVKLQRYQEAYEVLEKQSAESSVNSDLWQQQISELTSHLQQKQMEMENLNRQAGESLNGKDTEIEHYKIEVDRLNALLREKDKLHIQLQEKQAETEALHVQLQNYQQYTQNIEHKEIEINQLKLEMNNFKSLLNEKEKEYAQNLHATTQESETIFHEKAQELDIMKRRQMEAENRYDELLTAKEADMESLRLQLQEQINRHEIIMNNFQIQEGTINDFKIQLDVKTQECEELQSKVDEQEALHQEENKLLSELRQIIEDQVLKIEGLKQELFDKSKDYDSLIAELDIRKPSRSEPGTPLQERGEPFLSRHQTSMTEVTPTKPRTSEDDALEPANRAELDLALYMLHQRDVRCEELTVELMQLLEERDTLQLKLSNAIREKEELRNRFLPPSVTPDSAEGDVASTSSVSPIKSKASAIVLGATGTELATEATEQLRGDPLANKLSELKTVGYKRDKTLLDEQEQRRLQQLSLMQQHRDVAAMLPPEAAAKLVQDASYTLSRDVQSPPKVLLNWLWGKSTPKVNNI